MFGSFHGIYVQLSTRYSLAFNFFFNRDYFVLKSLVLCAGILYSTSSLNNTLQSYIIAGKLLKAGIFYIQNIDFLQMIFHI